MNLDELNVFTPEGKVTYSIRSMPYEKYFGEMNLSKEQIRKRIEFSEKFEDRLLEFLTLFTIASRYPDNDTFLKFQLEQLYFEIAAEYITVDNYVREHATEYAENFIEATKKHKTDAWYTSNDRAKFNAENEANNVLNYGEFQDAIQAGYTKKRWRSMRDNRVRPSHREVDGETIPITDTFLVGDTLLRFPGDSEFDTSDGEQTVGCRCTLEYL